MKNFDLKDKKVKGALVVVGAIIGLAFLYINLFGTPTTDNRNDKEIKTGESASFLNFNVPTINDTVKNENLSNVYDKNRRDSINNARLNSEALSYKPTPYNNASYPSSSSSASNESFSSSQFEAMRSSAIKNSHSTYGTPDMWSSKPSVDVGYSDMGNVISAPPPKAKATKRNNTEIVSSKTENINYELPAIPNPEPVKSRSREENLQDAISKKYGEGGVGKNISVRGEVFGQQMIGSSNNSVRIILSEKLVLNGVTIGTDANIYGIANVSGSNVTVSVPNISYKGKNYIVNLKVFDYRTGQLGIPVNLDNIVGALAERGESTASSELSRYGKIGSLLTSVLSGRNKTVNIQLNSGHQVYLKSAN